MKANINCTYERNQSHPLVVDKLNNVNNATKRKFKNDTSEHKRQKIIKDRNEIIEHAIHMQLSESDAQILTPKQLKHNDYFKN